jgi:hypothetical protein
VLFFSVSVACLLRQLHSITSANIHYSGKDKVHPITDHESPEAIQQRVTVVLRSIPKEAFADSFQKFMNVANRVL